MFHVSKIISDNNFMFKRSFNPILCDVRIIILKPGPKQGIWRRNSFGLNDRRPTKLLPVQRFTIASTIKRRMGHQPYKYH